MESCHEVQKDHELPWILPVLPIVLCNGEAYGFALRGVLRDNDRRAKETFPPRSTLFTVTFLSISLFPYSAFFFNQFSLKVNHLPV